MAALAITLLVLALAVIVLCVGAYVSGYISGLRQARRTRSTQTPRTPT